MSSVLLLHKSTYSITSASLRILVQERIQAKPLQGLQMSNVLLLQYGNHSITSASLRILVQHWPVQSGNSLQELEMCCLHCLFCGHHFGFNIARTYSGHISTGNDPPTDSGHISKSNHPSRICHGWVWDVYSGHTVVLT